MQTNYNEVAVLQQGAGKVTGARKLVKKIHMRDIEMSGKMKRLKRKMEVQKITFNYFARPLHRNWNFFMQWWWCPYKKYCCPVSKFVVGVWDGLEESEISRPEILFQSTPDQWRNTFELFEHTEQYLTFRGNFNNIFKNKTLGSDWESQEKFTKVQLMKVFMNLFPFD